jgi:hypothetical protein
MMDSGWILVSRESNLARAQSGPADSLDPEEEEDEDDGDDNGGVSFSSMTEALIVTLLAHLRKNEEGK